MQLSIDEAGKLLKRPELLWLLEAAVEHGFPAADPVPKSM